MEEPIQEGEAGDVQLRVFLGEPGTALDDLPVFVDLSDSDSKESLGLKLCGTTAIKSARYHPNTQAGQCSLCAYLEPHFFLCAVLRPHVFSLCAVPRPQVFSLAHLLLCAANWLSKLVLPMYRPLCFWLAGIALEDCP